MKKKILLSIIALSMTLTACASRIETDNVGAGSHCVDGCYCTGCACCEDSANREAVDLGTNEIQTLIEENSEEGVETQTQLEDIETAENTETENETPIEELKDAQLLTEEEKAAMRAQQAALAASREGLYALSNSKDKTTSINQIDKQILANNSYDFSGKNIVFIGDSITEGIRGAVDENGKFISYVTYADSYLHFQVVLNHGVGGRMFSDYGGEEYSITSNFDNVTNIDSDIIVVFAGVNDYLSVIPDKRFGNTDDVLSTAGFCGSVRNFMNQLRTYYSDRDIFFVTTYNISRTADCQYSDYEGNLSLGDYMDAERRLAREYGFNVIELYDTGFMDCSNGESSSYFLDDGLHPNDTGNIVLGEHIAAELSLYFSQKYQ